MSHDVGLWPRDGSLDLERVRAWLDVRPEWTIRERTAIYENTDTDVYFTLDVNGDDADEGEPPLLAVLNVYRPSFFGLEAAEVLGEFSAEFNLLGSDGTDERGERVPCNADWLLPRWNEANAAGYRTIGAQDSAPNPMPQSTLVEAWRWNRLRAGRQQQYVEDDVFVPRIMAIRTSAGLGTAVVWTDVIPFLLPPVSHVLVHRGSAPTRRRLRAPAQTQLQTRAAVLKVLGHLAMTSADWIEFVEQPAPPAIAAWAAALNSRKRDFNLVSWDKIHDEELLTR